MKCYLNQKRKKKMSKDAEKFVGQIVSEFMGKSIVYGPEQALEMMKADQKKENEQDEASL